jgi:GNAT superfamily N-acetyltransferase
MEIRALQPGDDRASFHSGDPDLDGFFLKFAGQNQFRHYLGVTYLAVDKGQILGYATVAPGCVEIDDLPATTRKRLPQYPLPVIRLARLAVDSSAQGQGVGRELLKFVLGLAVRMSDEYGCVGVLLDAKLGSVGFYEKHGFIQIDAIEGHSDARPAPIQMFLAIRAVRAAVGKNRR